jgi:hypothetical protein
MREEQAFSSKALLSILGQIRSMSTLPNQNLPTRVALLRFSKNVTPSPVSAALAITTN